MQPRGVDWLRLHLSRRVGSQVLMSARNSLTALLLSGTAALMVAQAAARAQQAPTAPEQRREERQERRQDQRQEHQEQRQSAPQRPAPQSQPAATDHPTAPATGPAAPGEQRPRGTQAQPQVPTQEPRDRRENRREGRDERRDERSTPPAPAAQSAPGSSAPSRQSTPAQPANPNSTAPAAPAASQEQQRARPQDRDVSREQRREEGRTRPAPATPSAPAPSAAPDQSQRAQPQAPAAVSPGAPPTVQNRRGRAGEGSASQSGAPATSPVPSTTQQREPAGTQQPLPAASGPQPPTDARMAPASAPAAVPPPTQARSSSQFIQQRGGASTDPQTTININVIKQDRQEVRQGDRTFIREPDRTIIREGNRSIIRHNEANRFAIDARDVRVQQRGNGQSETTVVRANGTRIVTVTDGEGRLVRRSRFDDRGREIVIIDNRFTGAAAGNALFLDISAPVYRGPRERYILDYGPGVRAEQIYDILEAPPIERIERRYTLDQVRFNAPLRDRMPRVDVDVHFETGSWQLTPEQIEKLAAIAEGMKRAIGRNPREVFMIEGHTDAVGSDEDNLSLSDRRAEAVAVALTEQLQVPAENLVTQGYGEQYLKEQTEGPSAVNRRVAVRRITPLLEQQASNTPPKRR
jgi:outer membrane protein OmpA-like peptidoglycan-associated protein